MPQTTAQSLDESALAESVKRAESLDEIASFTQLAWRARASESADAIPAMSISKREEYALVDGVDEVHSGRAASIVVDDLE